MRKHRTQDRRGRGLLSALAFFTLLLGGPVVEAVQTAYCEETYIGDCLNTQRCWFYDGSHLIGQGFVNYHCPV